MMAATPLSPPPPTPPPLDPALAAAWRTYFDYDTYSNQHKRTERVTNALVLISCFVTAIATLLHLYAKIRGLESYYLYESDPANLIPLWFADVPVYPLITYAMIGSALFFFVAAVYAYMEGRSSTSVERLAYRLCSILIIREIYLYRTGSGRYFGADFASAQRLLKQSVEAAEKRVTLMGVRPAGQTLSDTREALNDAIRSRVYPYRQDGFGPLSIEDYVQWRAQSSKDFYVYGSRTTERRSLRLYLIIFAVLFAAVLFAIIQIELLVLESLISALLLNRYIEIALARRVSRVFYEPAAAQIDTELENWNLLSPDERDPETASRFVERLENILQFEGEMYVLSLVVSSTGANINQQVIVTDLMQNGLALLTTNAQQISPIRYAKNSIFISYRRADSADIVGRIQDRLSAYFGRETIFRDVQTITAGEDFVKRILSAVNECRVLLAVIGPEWENIIDEETKERRLLNSEDYVRREIAEALKRPDVIVIPLLVRGAPPPDRDALPDDLKELTFRNGLLVRTDPDFEEDVKRLISAVEFSVRQ